MKWSACLVCINDWELPWYQCYVRFLVFPDKQQAELVLLEEKGGASCEGWRGLCPQSLRSLAFLVRPGELSRWKGLGLVTGQGGLSPTPAAAQDDTGLFQFPELWKFLPYFSGISSILPPGPWDSLTPYEAHFFLCSCALLRVKGGGGREQPAFSPLAATLQKQRSYLDSALPVWGRGF